jgi:hypothetical protein
MEATYEAHDKTLTVQTERCGASAKTKILDVGVEADFDENGRLLSVTFRGVTDVRVWEAPTPVLRRRP